MATSQVQSTSDHQETGNVTIRKKSDIPKNNMAHQVKRALNQDSGSSILIDSILSQDEEKDIVSMMIMADEHDAYSRLPSFCTSTQMGGRDPLRRPYSPLLSPLRTPGAGSQLGSGQRRATFGDYNKSMLPGERTDRSTARARDVFLNLKNSFGPLEVSYSPGGDFERGGESPQRSAWISKNSPSKSERAERHEQAQRHDTLPVTAEVVAIASNQDGHGNGDVDHRNDDEDNVNIAPVNLKPAGESGTVAELGRGVAADGADVSEANGQSNFKVLAAKLETVEGFMETIDKRSISLGKTVKDLEDSLTFSQQQIDELRRENAELKKQVGKVELEDRRTQFQVKMVEGKLDKLETTSKKKNLLFEGIPEKTDHKEDAEGTIGELFDQIGVNKGINFDACFRIGPYNKNRARPILVSFERQEERDMIYSRRFELKGTKDYQRVWVNEDMGPLSKRKRGLIQLITKEAQRQGVDCRTGKYSISIDRKKYDGDNLDELPCKLHPSLLKQVQIDDRTLAYQSELAPFSSFYPCKIVCGSHTFFCLEQAFQFVRAKNLNKPLAATRIYLSRDVHFIKQLGHELGTSDAWEAREFDVMYECMKKKYEQNPDLKALLLKTDDLELVEATPDRLWGCGATLSSTVIRKHTWPGQNKHGVILMTIREELRNASRI